MKLTVGQYTLLKALETVSNAITGKTPMDILGNVKIEVKDGKVELTCSNLDKTIKTQFQARDYESGSVLVNDKLLIGYIKKLNAESENIVIKEVKAEKEKNSHLEIKQNKSKSEFICQEADEYPDMNQYKENIIRLNVVQSELKAALKETIYAASSNECRPMLTGVNFDIHDGQMTLVALDAYRMAYRTIEVDYEENKTVIIPAEELKSVERILDNNEDNVTIEIGDDAATFIAGDTSISIRLLQGQYVNYRQIIESYKNTPIIIRVNREELLESISRVALLSASPASQNDKTNLMKINILKEKIIISANNFMGSAEDEITPVKFSGEMKEFKIAFNSNYWVQLLSSLKEDEIEIRFKSSSNPAIITKVEDDSYLGFILPVRICK